MSLFQIRKLEKIKKGDTKYSPKYIVQQRCKEIQFYTQDIYIILQGNWQPYYNKVYVYGTMYEVILESNFRKFQVPVRFRRTESML